MAVFGTTGWGNGGDWMVLLDGYRELEDAYKKSLKLKNGLINMYDILD